MRKEKEDRKECAKYSDLSLNICILSLKLLIFLYSITVFFVYQDYLFIKFFADNIDFAIFISNKSILKIFILI